jgi:hypothetical protein
MTIVELAGTLAAFTTVIAIIGAFVFRLIKNSMVLLINGVIRDYLQELKPNSGSSMRDEIKDIRTDTMILKMDVAALEGKFDQHIAENVRHPHNV